LAPGSKVVTEYLKKSGSMPALEALGFYVVGYGCTTCIGNSGPLPDAVENAIKGYRDAWRTLPPSVKTIIIISDNPKARKDTLDCIERAVGDRQPAGTACAIPRGFVVERFTDAAPEAARRLNKANVGVINLTDFYCDKKLCYPVIGGVLVLADKSHLTPLFNTTLVPYLLRALDRGGWLKR
jgi:hypothetical protein